MTRILPASRALCLTPQPQFAAPEPAAREMEAPRPAARAEPARTVLWTLSRETAIAACAVQMIARPRRGLKADPAERARFAHAYAGAAPNPAAGGRLKASA